MPSAPSAARPSVITRIEELAVARTNHPALIGGDRTLTFAEMNRAANRLARALRNLLGSTEGFVAICLPRNVDRVVAALGVLKAGHAYVPIDPALHDSGRRDLAAHAGAVAVIADAAHASSFAAGPPVLDIGALLAPGREDDPGIHPPPEAPAYIRYTSGSTGAPKGVLHNHLAALGQSMAYADATAIRAGDRMCCLTFFPHPIMWGTLLSRAAWSAIDPTSTGLRGILARLRQDPVSILSATPSTLRTLATALAGAPPLADLRCIALSGEPATAADINLALRHVAPGGTAINNYGTSEFTQVASHHLSAPVPENAPVPVGRPPAGVELRVLGADGAPVLPGEAGEVAVRARFMSSGYWNRPDITRAVFGSDTPQDGQTDYRTGDIGRIGADGALGLIGADGALVLLGRTDNQIKLRGYRFSPEEIEAVLRRHPAVAEAAVRAFTGADTAASLIAFLVPAADNVLDTTALRAHVRAHLPPYMIPAVFISRDTLPLTQGGKLDRAALPDPKP